MGRLKFAHMGLVVLRVLRELRGLSCKTFSPQGGTSLGFVAELQYPFLVEHE